MTKTSVKLLWVRAHSTHMSIALFGAALVIYLNACAVLWSVSQLFGIAEFSWMNGFYMTVLMGSIYIIMHKDD